MTRPYALEGSPKTLRKVIVAAAIGNFVEWFDFAIYGFLATTIAQQFFPSGDASAALLKTFAVFAVAFAFRPLGGIFFGMLGDRIGRKRTLAMTILLMAGATTLIGVLPTYAAIGVLAPILLTLIRCAQGFCAGGEYAGACAYLMEHAPHDKRAWYGSFLPVSTFSAFAAAAVVAYALEASLLCVVNGGGLSVVSDGQFRRVCRLSDRRDAVGDGRGVVWRGDGRLALGNLSNANALYRLCHHLQHGLHFVWWHGTAGGDMADHHHGQQPVTGVLSDRSCRACAGGRIGIAGDLKDFAA